jgi:hypothetical protein
MNNSIPSWYHIGCFTLFLEVEFVFVWSCKIEIETFGKNECVAKNLIFPFEQLWVNWIGRLTNIFGGDSIIVSASFVATSISGSSV